MSQISHNPLNHPQLIGQSAIPRWYADMIGGMINRANSYERPHQHLTTEQKMRRLYGDEVVEEILVVYNVLR